MLVDGSATINSLTIRMCTVSTVLCDGLGVFPLYTQCFQDRLHIQLDSDQAKAVTDFVEQLSRVVVCLFFVFVSSPPHNHPRYFNA